MTEDSIEEKRDHCSDCPFFLPKQGEAYCGFPVPDEDGDIRMEMKLTEIAYCDRWRRTLHTIPFYLNEEESNG